MTGRTKNTIAAVLLFVQFSIPFAFSQSAKRPAPTPFPTLTQRPIEREIRSGEVHTYSFELDSGKSAEIRADQTTVDISLRLFGPEGRELVVVNNVPGLEEMEVVPVTAKVRTRFRLEVRPTGTGSGLYMIRLAEPRTEVVSAKKPVEESVVIGPVGSAEELLARLIAVRDEQAATKLVDENRRFFNLALVFAFFRESVRLAVAETPRDRLLQITKVGLKLAELLGSEAALGTAYVILSRAYADVGKADETLEYSAKSIEICRRLNDPRNVVWADVTVALANLQAGRAYMYKGDFERSLERTLLSIGTFEREYKRSPDANAKLNLSASYWNAGTAFTGKKDPARALEYLEKALPFIEEIGSRRRLVSLLSNIGDTSWQNGEYNRAVEVFERIQLLADSADLIPARGYASERLAMVYGAQGQYLKAAETFEKTLTIAEELGSYRALIGVLGNLAYAQNALGNAGQAFSHLERALEIAESMGDTRRIGGTLILLGQLYSNLGDHEQASEHFRRALATVEANVTKSSGYTLRMHKTEIATILNELGHIRKFQGSSADALNYYKQSLEILETLQRESKSSTGVAGGLESFEKLLVTTYENIGDVYASQGEFESSFKYHEQALGAAEKTRQGAIIANSLQKLADSLRGQKKFDRSLASVRLAIEAAERAGGSPHILWKMHHTAGLVYQELGKAEEALKSFGRAIDSVESTRSFTPNSFERATLFSKLQDPYARSIRLLMDLHARDRTAGYDVRAFEISERQRARSLLDSLNESRSDVREGVDEALLKREREIRRLLNSAAQSQLRIVTDSEGVAIESDAKENEELLRKTISRLTLDYIALEAEIKQKSPRYGSLTRPQPLSLREIQESVLDSDTVLLQYSLAEEKSFLWAVTRSSITAYELPPKAEIERLVRRSYGLASDGNGVAQETVQAALRRESVLLSDMLLKPVAGVIRDKRIVVVSDGALQYLPFGALPVADQQADERKPLIAGNEVVILPSASVLSVLRRGASDRPGASKTVAVLADPVFSAADERLAAAMRSPSRKPGYPSASLRSSELFLVRALRSQQSNEGREAMVARLPFSRREAEAITSLSGPANSLRALDFKASMATAMGGSLKAYRIVHFATHGLLNSEQPELSGLVLSLFNEKGEQVEGFLRMNEIYNMNLSADLVVLSACETALGKEIRGEGLMALTRGFMYAGSPRVVASLWKVDDVATAELMKIFYRKMLQEKMPAAAALRAAKVEMMKQKRWNAPFYWAAFELQGEWR